MVVDGVGWDNDELEDIGWLIWIWVIILCGMYIMFFGCKEELLINVLIQCGGVVVKFGDFIVVDLMGVIVIFFEKVEEIVGFVKEQVDCEEEICKWVVKGKIVEDLFNEFGWI